MSVSAAVQSSSPVPELPSGAGNVAHDGSSGVVDVLFPLIDDEQWPPVPAEMLDAVLTAHDLAEIKGVPWFVTNISRGDIVRVGHDGIGYVGGTVVGRGGHSTVHVMATSEAELAAIVERLHLIGASTAAGLTPPMLTVDVSENCSLDEVLDVLTAAESMTCAFTLACRQHRSRVARDDLAS